MLTNKKDIKLIISTRINYIFSFIKIQEEYKVSIYSFSKRPIDNLLFTEFYQEMSKKITKHKTKQKIKTMIVNLM